MMTIIMILIYYTIIKYNMIYNINGAKNNMYEYYTIIIMIYYNNNNNHNIIYNDKTNNILYKNNNNNLWRCRPPRGRQWAQSGKMCHRGGRTLIIIIQYTMLINIMCTIITITIIIIIVIQYIIPAKTPPGFKCINNMLIAYERVQAVPLRSSHRPGPTQLRRQGRQQFG